MTHLFACMGVALALLSCPVQAMDSTRQPRPEPAEPSFTVSSFRVEGPELLPRQDVMEVLRAFQGRPITFSELRLATATVERLHAIAGYEVVRVLIPEQDLTAEQSLTLQIVDARLDVVQISGNQFFSSEHIQSQLPVLREGALINTREMDKNLRLANENPARVLRVSLEPSDKPLLVDARVAVADFEPRSYYLTLDNTGTEATGKYRMGLVAQHNNVFGLGHMLSAQVISSPGRWSDVKVFGLGYKVPFPVFDSLLDFSLVDSSVEVGSLRVGGSALNISGSGQTASFKWIRLLDRLDGLDQRVTLSYELKNFNSEVKLEGGTGSLIPDVGSRPLGLSYQLIGKEEVIQQQLSLSYFRNIYTGGKNSQAAYTAINPLAEVDFQVLKFNASHSRPFLGDWRFTASADAQYSNDVLISGEQFGAGGAYSVRGFEERVISADSGARLSLEWMSGNRSAWTGGFVPRLNLVTFVEGAKLELKSPTPGVKEDPSLSSFGGGVRFAFKPEHQFRVDVARVIGGIPTRSSGETKVHFSFVSSL